MSLGYAWMTVFACLCMLEPCFTRASIPVHVCSIRLKKGYTRSVLSSWRPTLCLLLHSADDDDASDDDAIVVAPHPRPPPARTSRLSFMRILAWMSCNQKEGRGRLDSHHQDGWRAVIRTATASPCCLPCLTSSRLMSYVSCIMRGIIYIMK